MMNKKGFTMAELLITTAIIGTLAGVSFIAIQKYQETLQQKEEEAKQTEQYQEEKNTGLIFENTPYEIKVGESINMKVLSSDNMMVGIAGSYTEDAGKGIVIVTHDSVFGVSEGEAYVYVTAHNGETGRVKVKVLPADPVEPEPDPEPDTYYVPAPEPAPQQVPQPEPQKEPEPEPVKQEDKQPDQPEVLPDPAIDIPPDPPVEMGTDAIGYVS